MAIGACGGPAFRWFGVLRLFVCQQLEQDFALIRASFRFQHSLELHNIMGLDKVQKGGEALLGS